MVSKFTLHQGLIAKMSCLEFAIKSSLSNLDSTECLVQRWVSQYPYLAAKITFRWLVSTANLCFTITNASIYTKLTQNKHSIISNAILKSNCHLLGL